LLLAVLAPISYAQELQPRAYVPAPVGLGFFSIGVSSNRGGLLFDPSLPIQNAQVTAAIPSVALGETLNVFGRSGQVLIVLPYVVANLSGTFAGSQQSRYRSGLGDSLFRFSTNLYGARAMSLREFKDYRPKTIVGVSISVLAPTGQYDPNALINIGANRWAFKPEVGVSRSYRKWDFEAAFGAWLYTTNTAYYGHTFRGQDPLGSVQLHVVRDLPRRCWFAFDATYFTGGRSNVGNTAKPDYQANSRLGATFGISLKKHQALRFAYFRGAVTRVGTDISSVSVTYQVIWNRGR
jgi:Putative MetA-pathway of phenol degradation